MIIDFEWLLALNRQPTYHSMSHQRRSRKFLNFCVQTAPSRLSYDRGAMRLFKRLVIAALAFGVTGLSALPVRAQRAPLPLGTVVDTGKLQSCPSGYYPGMSCFRGQVDNCQNASILGFTYGYKNPEGEVLGTVVFLEGGGGTNAYDYPTYAQTYLANGYQVIYMAWDTDWELTDGESGTNIKDAACRPATVLNYLYDNFYSRGGMCAQGSSAGSGALGYALAWYGSAGILDNVEMLSGPVFGDIEQGCEVPNAPTVTICAEGQYGCDGAPWPDSPAYVDGDENPIRRWSGQPSCNAGKTTSALVNSLWKGMSIIDGSDNASFNYPQTALAGYLCSNIDSIQNNSAAQGEFFYQQFTSSFQTAEYSLTRMNHCNGSEGVTNGQTPQGETGFEAISNHMLSACVSRHKHKVHERD